MGLSDSDLSFVKQAFRLANRAVVEDIESNCTVVIIDGQRWHDTHPMLDEREHSNEVLDMTTEALSFAEAARIIARHPTKQHLVRIVHHPININII